MQTATTEYKRNNGVTIKQMSERVLKRSDNPYKIEYIRDIIALYCDECRKALKNGEKILISGVGTLTPKPHTSKHSFVPEIGYTQIDPYMSVQYILNRSLRDELNARYRKNIKKGFAGLSEHCICTPQQKGMLINKGYLVDDEDVFEEAYTDEE